MDTKSQPLRFVDEKAEFLRRLQSYTARGKWTVVDSYDGHKVEFRLYVDEWAFGASVALVSLSQYELAQKIAVEAAIRYGKDMILSRGALFSPVYGR